MRSKPSLELLLSLRTRNNRDRLGLYYVEGLRFAYSALQNEHVIDGYAWCPELLHQKSAEPVLKRLARFPSLRLTKLQFEQLRFAPDPHGILLILRQRSTALNQVRLKHGETWIGLEAIRNPGNLGTILRTARASGCAGVMLFGNRGETLDIFDPLALRASMGAAIGLRVVHSTYRELRNWSYRSEIRVLGADVEGQLNPWTTKLTRNVLFMMGEERSGLSPGQRSQCDEFVRIPMAPGVDSLNVATSAAVLLYEAFRQKQFRSNRGKIKRCLSL